MNFKPMLSASLDGVDLSTLRYPLLASPKLDGVRCIVWEGVAYSRNAKPIRNRFVQEWAKKHHNLDGELVVGLPTDPHCLNNTQSGVMSFDGEPDFTFWLFDCVECDYPSFEDRLSFVQHEKEGEDRIRNVDHSAVNSAPELIKFEEECLFHGYEGIMLRSPTGPYKNGRSTLREGYLMKLKRFIDGEAVVIGLEEGTINENELKRDELGRAKRQRLSENMVPSGMVGTLICHSEQWGTIRVSPGIMTHGERQSLWKEYTRPWDDSSENQKPTSIIGKTIHWRSFGYGTKDKPRFPRYYGIRDDNV